MAFPLSLILLALLGVAVGAFGTLVGAGGGFIVTPVLLLVYRDDSPQTLTAISLAVVFFNAASGTAAYTRLRRIDYRSGTVFALATLPGAVAGALLVAHASRRLFDPIMGLLLLALGAWLLTKHRPAPARAANLRWPRRTIVDRDGERYEYRVPVLRGVAYSTVVGFVSSFLGIGGGIIHVPLLVRALGFPVHVATATSHFVLAIMAGAGSLTHVVASSFAHEGVRRMAALSIGVIIGAQLGARLSGRTTGTAIQRLLAVALLGLAVRLLLAAA